MKIRLLRLGVAPTRRVAQLWVLAFVGASCASSPTEKLRHDISPHSHATMPRQQEGDEELVRPKTAGAEPLDSEEEASTDSAAPVVPERPPRVEYDIPYLKNAGSLTRYLGALERLELKGHGIVRVSHFGDSHSAADIVTTKIRRTLQDRFGDGGRGYVLLGRPWKYYRPKDVHLEDSGRWVPHRFKVTVPSDELDGRYGFGGVAVECDVGRCSVSLRPSTGRYGNDFDHFELYYSEQPGGGSFDLRAGRKPRTRIDTEADSFDSAFFSLDLEADQDRLIELRTAGDGPVRLFGAVVEREGPGVVYDTLGINGATFGTTLQWDRELFVEQLQRRSPDLIVAMYGTNETCSKTLTPTDYAENVKEALQMFHEGAPKAACLLIGPPDRQGKPEELERLAWVISVQREVAKEQGCAFLNLREIMGGSGSHALWQARGLAAPDGIHLTMRGYNKLGEEIVGILLNAYEVFREASHKQNKDETTRPTMPGAQESLTPQKRDEARDANGPT